VERAADAARAARRSRKVSLVLPAELAPAAGERRSTGGGGAVAAAAAAQGRHSAA